MPRTLALACAAALAVAYDGRPAADQQRQPIDLEADCDSTHYTFGDYQVATATDHVSVPVGAGALDIRPDGNGGVRIERGSGGVYAITACIGAGARTREDAQAAAGGIRLDVSGSRVRLRDDGQTTRAHAWSAQLLVTIPDGASVTAETSNGPIGVRGVTATLDLRASNGPIGLENVGGDVKAHASNGPISVEGGRGEFDLETANGPISVTLDGQRWDGHLSARAGNGPLSLDVPQGYQSGVEVRSSNNSPWTCRAAACGARGTRDWDDRARLLRIGSDPIVVHLSTVNGPVTVSDSR
jgi:hypothetical protein